MSRHKLPHEGLLSDGSQTTSPKKPGATNKSKRRGLGSTPRRCHQHHHKQLKQYKHHARGSYVTASSAEEWRHHATEDGSHLNEKATKIRTASALKKQNSKGLSQKQQGPACTEPLKRSPSESILELRSILPPVVSEQSLPA